MQNDTQSCEVLILGAGPSGVGEVRSTLVEVAARVAVAASAAVTATGGVVGSGASLILDASGEPHISYLDSTSQQLVYARYDGAGWIHLTVDTGLPVDPNRIYAGSTLYLPTGEYFRSPSAPPAEAPPAEAVKVAAGAAEPPKPEKPTGSRPPGPTPPQPPTLPTSDS